VTEDGHFMRRVLALIVDYALASAVAILLVLPFLGNPERIRLGGGLDATRHECTEAAPGPQAWADLIAPHPLTAAVVCRTWVWGVDNGLTVSLLSVETSANTTMTRQLSLPIDEAGAFVRPLYPQSPLTLAILILGGGVLLRTWGATPGKRLLGLRVEGVTGAGRGMAREALRFLPWIAGLALFQWMLIQPGAFLASLGLLFAGVGAAGAFVFWYWVWPVVRWRGTLRHDRWLGMTVRRAV
jgi:RDD family